MTATEIIAAARVQLGDEFENYKWTATDMINYLNNALNIIAGETGYFIDTYTTGTVNITLSAHTQDYLYSSNIYEITDAKISGETAFLTKTTLREINDSIPAWRWVTTTNENDATPTKYLLDYRYGYISLYPCPDDSETLVLETIRKSSYTLSATEYIADFSTAVLAGVPNIRTEYHYTIVDGICWRAYLKNGEHTYDSNKSKELYNLFMRGIENMKRDKIKLHSRNNILTPHSGNL